MNSADLAPIEEPRAPNGRYLFSPGPGRPRGSPNKISRLIRERIAAQIESGARVHPAEVLLDLCNDSQQRPAIRLRAASELLPYLLTAKFSLSVETPDPIDEDRVQKIKRTLAALWIEERREQ